MGALWHVRGSFIKTVYNEGLSPNSGCVKTALNSIKIILTTKTSRQTLPSAVGQSRQSEREGSRRARAGLGGSAGSSKEHITGLLITAENAVATAEFLLLSVPFLLPFLSPAIYRFPSTRMSAGKEGKSKDSTFLTGVSVIHRVNDKSQIFSWLSFHEFCGCPLLDLSFNFFWITLFQVASIRNSFFSTWLSRLHVQSLPWGLLAIPGNPFGEDQEDPSLAFSHMIFTWTLEIVKHPKALSNGSQCRSPLGTLPTKPELLLSFRIPCLQLD